MSDAEKRRMQKELEDKNTEYQFLANKLQKLVNERQQEILGLMAPKLDAVLKDMIAKEAYDLVVHRQNVLYVDPKYDITTQVTEQLNLKK
jgi:Skp family chaperone for outer membrane proteins